MFGPNNLANPTGTAGAFDFRAKLLKALGVVGKRKGVSPEARIAALFFKSDKCALQILPYIAPRLRALEVSGQVSVPFQFIIEQVNGDPLELPPAQAAKQIASQVVQPIAIDVPTQPACTNKRVPIAKAKSKRTTKPKAASKAKRGRK